MKPVGLLVLMPTRGAVSIETLMCLAENMDGYPHELLTVFRKPVEVACNELHRQARALDPETLDFDPKYVMGIANDTYWGPGLVSRAIEILEENPDIGVVSPLGSFRMAYSPPTCAPLYGKHATTDGKVAILRCNPGELIPLSFFAGGIMRREVLGVITDDPFKTMPYTLEGVLPLRLSEDFSYAYRLRQKGVRAVTERSLIVGHVDTTNGLVYFPDRAPMIANGAGQPIHERLAERAKVKSFSLHDLRDTHASLLAKNGVPLEVVSKPLGRSSIGVTAERYLHVYSDRDAAAASVLDTLCG